MEVLVAGTARAGSSTLSADGRSITFSPTDLLPANTQVTVRTVNVVSADGTALPATSWAFTTANPPSQSLFATLSPVVTTSTETRAIELGATFRTSQAGHVTAIRFYKGPLNTGVHYGSLWTSAGTRLARVPFANETASGWQTALLPTPVPLAEATDYVVSYNAPVGRYSFTTAFFTQPWSSGYLTAPAARNGLYRFGAGTAVPNRTDNSTNYFVDVVFSPAA